MHIELLWLIPVLAFALFVFLIAYYAQNQSEKSNRAKNLSKEVALYNAGHLNSSIPVKPDDRLNDLERTVSSFTESLASHQKSLLEIRKDSDVSAHEVEDLKEKLRSVLKEYDIVLSENYALRAKVKQLLKQAEERSDKGSAEKSPDLIVARAATATSARKLMHLEDTRLYNISAQNEFVDDDSRSKSR